MKQEVREALIHQYGSLDKAPQNVINVLAKNPQFIYGLPVRIPWKWRGMDEAALTNIMDLQHQLLGPNGPFRNIAVKVAANPYPGRSRGRRPRMAWEAFLDGLDKQTRKVSKGVKGTTSKYTKILVTDPLTAKTKKAGKTKQARKQEKKLQDAQAEIERLKAKKNPSRKRTKAGTRKNPISSPRQRDLVITITNFHATQPAFMTNPFQAYSVNKNEKGTKVGQIIAVGYLSNREGSWNVYIHGFNTVLEGKETLLDCADKIIRKAGGDIARKLAGSNRLVAHDNHRHFFFRLGSRKGEVQKNSAYPQGIKASVPKLSPNSDLLGVLGPIQFIVWRYSTPEGDRLGIVGFNSVFEGASDTMMQCIERIAKGSPRSIKKLTGPDLILFPDGDSAVFSARMSDRGILDH